MRAVNCGVLFHILEVRVDRSNEILLKVYLSGKRRETRTVRHVHAELVRRPNAQAVWWELEQTRVLGVQNQRPQLYEQV